MKAILIQDVKNLGKKNDVVEISDGYFKNYLSKNKLAVIYSKEAISILNKDLDKIKQEQNAQIKKANALKQTIESITLSFKLKAKDGNAFGSISEKQIIDELKKSNIEITKFMFESTFEPLKLGHTTINLNVFKGIQAQLKINVDEE